MKDHRTKRPFIVLAAQERTQCEEIFGHTGANTLDTLRVPIRCIGRMASHELPVVLDFAGSVTATVHRFGHLLVELAHPTTPQQPSVSSAASVQAIAA